MKIHYYGAAIALCLSGNAYAQDWFGKANDLLGSDIAKEAIGTIAGGETSAGNHKTMDISGLANGDIIAGLKQALEIGAKQVVARLGTENGFYGDDAIRIPLPGALSKVDTALATIGAGELTDDLKLRMNRAAETAVPKAKALFVNAISDMSFDDARAILGGPDNAATSYLRKAMGPQLLQEMQPIITAAMAQTGVMKAYDSVIGEYQQLPFVSEVKTNLHDYVGDKALDGIFHYVASEEKSIRENPAARSTDLLKKVFGS